MLTIRRHWSMEIPPEWTQRLREISPVSSVVSWLTLRWFPFRLENGEDGGRWLLYECVPMSSLPISQRLDMVDLLGGVPPRFMDTSTEERRRSKAVRMMFADDWQCDMYHQHDVWARQLWILQGDTGGHALQYEEAEQDLLRLYGLPTDPPAVGELPYAPFDERVVQQMQRRNRLIQVGNDLHELKRTATSEAVQSEWAADQKAYRAAYVQFLEEQQQPQVEFLKTFSKTTECRGIVPAMSRVEMNAADQAKDLYIDTGDVPYVPTH